jgi:small subunit ribosomal protein S9
MSDEQRQEDEGQPSEPAETAEPAADATEPVAGQEPSEQQSTEEPGEPAADEPGEQQAADEPAEAPAAEEAESAGDGGAGEEKQGERAAKAAPEKPAASESEQPPGAELDPIAIEPERQLDAEERARLEAEAEERARLEAEATAEAGEEPVARRAPKVDLPADARIQATGKRKSSVARVLLRAGSGSFEINSRSLEEYFPRQYDQTLVRQALITSGYEGSVDVRVRVYGGGVSGQAGAVRHGLARALVEVDSQLRGELKQRGLLTRDARRKERRKAGLKKARKRPQFSKR